MHPSQRARTDLPAHAGGRETSDGALSRCVAAAAGFPANVNVAAALSLAGIGPDRTMMEIWADPSVERNCHSVEVESDSACFTLSIKNIPSENPRTGRITALSVL